jgi:glutathione peroxidase
MQLFKRFIQLFVIAIVLFVVYIWITKKDMTFRQALMKKLYGTIMLPGKLFGSNNAIFYNLSNTTPLVDVYNISFENSNGTITNLEAYKGKKIVIVNTASDCGYTGQYEELETLYQQYKNSLVVIAFPANDFKNQESGSDDAIANFCKKNYGVSFPIMKKSQVIAGKQQNPLFHWLCNPKENGWNNHEPVWNFCKFIIDEHGVLTHVFKNTVSPLNAKFIQAIE